MPWENRREEWIEAPVEQVARLEPYKERGKKLLKAYFRKSLEHYQLKIAIGKAKTEKEGEMGAFLGVGFDDEELILFTYAEMEHMIHFLKNLPDHVQAIMDEGDPDDFEGFIRNLDQAAQAAKMYFEGKPN